MHVIHRDIVARSAQPVTAQSQFDIINFFRVKIGGFLASLESVELCGLWRTKTARYSQVDYMIFSDTVAGSGVKRPVGKVVLPVRRPVKTAVGCLGPAARTVCGFVVVVIAGVFEPHPAVDLPR